MSPHGPDKPATFRYTDPSNYFLILLQTGPITSWTASPHFGAFRHPLSGKFSSGKPVTDSLPPSGPRPRAEKSVAVSLNPHIQLNPYNRLETPKRYSREILIFQVLIPIMGSAGHLVGSEFEVA